MIWKQVVLLIVVIYNDMPFISLRSVSDLADKSSDETYEVNEKQAADQVGKLLLSVLEKESFLF